MESQDSKKKQLRLTRDTVANLPVKSSIKTGDYTAKHKSNQAPSESHDV